MKTVALASAVLAPAVCVVAVAVQAWPNLDTIRHPGYPNASKSCGLSGNAAANSRQGIINVLKNRYRQADLPTSYTAMTFPQMFNLQPGKYPNDATTNNLVRRGVQITGFVKKVS